MRTTRRTWTIAIGLIVVGLALPETAHATDGVTLVNQGTALAGNVTPGDTPGFPITITLAGSYRLVGNLTVPDANTGAILIQTSDVTLDLNGFTIAGPALSGTGNGISTTTTPLLSRITIRNGVIRGMGNSGIDVARGIAPGNGHVVEGVTVSDSKGGAGASTYGIHVGSSSLVKHCVARSNSTTAGIGAFGSAIIMENLVEGTSGDGISLGVGSVTGNVVRMNGDVGIFNAGGLAVASRNILDSNTTMDIAGVSALDNFCSGVAC
jgi:hypothetical protein